MNSLHACSELEVIKRRNNMSTSMFEQMVHDGVFLIKRENVANGYMLKTKRACIMVTKVVLDANYKLTEKELAEIETLKEMKDE